MSDDKRAAVCLWLWTVLGYNPKRTSEFLLSFSDPEEGYELAVHGDLDEEIFPCRDFSAVTEKSLEFYGDTLEYYRKKGIKTVTFYDKEYPINLAMSENPLPVLFVKGEIPEMYKKPSVSFVGTRSCTSDGARFCARMGYGLALHGFSVVSGVSAGIESAALIGAVQSSEGNPVAVIPSEIEKIYPSESERLCFSVAEKGAVVSMFPSYAKIPIRQAFSVSNYVLGTISHGTVLFEATQNSGSLSAVKSAKRQGRLVFAVPGQPEDLLSSAANDLIKKGTKICTGLNDVIDAYNETYSVLYGGEIKKISKSKLAKARNAEKKQKREETESFINSLTEDEKRILNSLSSSKQIDVICDELGLSFPEVATVLQNLEVQKAVKNTENGYVSVLG